MTKLKKLNLGYTKLSTLPDSFGNLTQLEELGLGYTQLSTLPDSFGNLTQLKKLNLGYTKLSTLPDSFGNLTQLEELYLSNTQLSSLPESFANLKNLKILYLPFNNFTKLSKSIWTLFSKIKPRLLFEKSNHKISFYEFKQIFASISDSTLIEYLDNLAIQLFPNERVKELDEIIESDGVIFQKAVKSTHQNWLGIGNTLARTIYGTLIGAGLLRIYDILFDTVVNLQIFLFVLVMLLGVFGIIMWRVIKQEHKLRGKRRIFVDDTKKSLSMDVEAYQTILKSKYFSTESDMKAARYNLLVGFTSNLIIASVTSLIFTVFTSDPDVLNFILNPSEWGENFKLLLLFFAVLYIFSIPTLVYLFTKSIPDLGTKMRSDLNSLAKTYKKLQEEEMNRLEAERTKDKSEQFEISHTPKKLPPMDSQ